MKKLILLVLLPVSINAQNADSIFIKQIANDILLNGKAYNLLRELTKNIGGRLAGSPQYNKAVIWGANALKKAGADTVFLQECLVPNWKRGNGDVLFTTNITTKQKKSLSFTALGNSLGTEKPIKAEYVLINDYSELELRKNELKGKIVFYNAGFNATNIKPFKSYGETGMYRRNGASRAAKYGAVGIIIRSLTEATDNHAHTGSMTYNDSFPKIPAVSVGLEDANYLAANQSNKNIIITMHTYGKFLPDTINHNVIAELKGAEPNMYITIGGHLDSWDVAEGAHDDGAGIVQTIEVLRVLKALGYKPKHTLRFVLFANEENGLRGGNKYAEIAKANQENHVFALESDAGGFTPRGFGFTVNTHQLKKIQQWLPLLKPYGTEELSSGGGGADIGPLNKLLGTALAGLQPDAQRYFDVHHAKTDTFETVNKRELLLGAVNMAALIYLVDKYGM